MILPLAWVVEVWRWAVMKRDNKVAVVALRALPMFRPLTEERLAALAKVATLRSVPRHGVVVSAGDQIDCIYLILTGGLKVLMGDQEGREVILSMLGPGDFFGEMGVIDDHPRSATVRATDESSLVVIPQAAFQRCMAENAEVALYVMRDLVKRLRVADRKIESLSLLDVYGRVARVLLDLAEDRGGRKVVARRITRQDISQMVGASREMVSRVMRDLQLRGLIDEKDDLIWLTDGIDPGAGASHT